MERQVVTVPEAAEILQVSRATMYGLVASGQEPSIALGRLRRISLPALWQFLGVPQPTEALLPQDEPQPRTNRPQPVPVAWLEDDRLVVDLKAVSGLVAGPGSGSGFPMITLTATITGWRSQPVHPGRLASGVS